MTNPCSNLCLSCSLDMLCTIRDLLCLCLHFRYGAGGSARNLFPVSKATESCCSTSNCTSAETSCGTDRDGQTKGEEGRNDTNGSASHGTYGCTCCAANDCPSSCCCSSNPGPCGGGKGCDLT